MKPYLLFPTLLLTALLSPTLPAKDAAGAADHPLLKRIEGSEIIWAKTTKFDEYTIPLEQVLFDYDKQTFKPTKTEKVEGARTTLYYKLPGETSTLEAVKQYEADLKPAGFETLFTAANDKLDDGFNRFVSQTFPTVKGATNLEYLHEFNHDEQRFMALKGTGKSGNAIYVTLYAFVLQDVSTGFDELKESHQLDKGQTLLRVDVLETKAMEARMTVVKAAEITSSIQQTGRIAIYGVLFDTGKADLKPESADSLAEMAAAIQATPGKKYLIVGHTDNVGDFALNQTLSKNRAAAVTAALTKTYGVPASSLIPVGVGMAAPTAPNTDETGRAKNRRVEIVAM
jgi:outer membrane protein OmpA-like peptidoglycan-associated protein